MIIFDLDGTLADCEHRRHFVDPSKNPEYEQVFYYGQGVMHSAGWYHKSLVTIANPPQRVKFIPDWKSFYEACDQDKPIIPVINVLRCHWSMMNYEMEIWSGRCESVREKTEKWLQNYGALKCKLKMRPIGDNTPDDQLKERWLDEAIEQGKTVEFVFDDRPKVRRMWQRRGIFVFNCQQSDEEF